MQIVYWTIRMIWLARVCLTTCIQKTLPKLKSSCHRQTRLHGNDSSMPKVMFVFINVAILLTFKPKALELMLGSLKLVYLWRLTSLPAPPDCVQGPDDLSSVEWNATVHLSRWRTRTSPQPALKRKVSLTLQLVCMG